MKDPGKLLRLFRTVNLLSSPGKGYLVAELCEEFGVSFKTVYRDLDILEKTGIELLRSDTGRYRVARGFDLHRQLHFSPEESDVLLHAVAALPESQIRQFLEMKLSAMTDPTLKLTMILSQKTGSFLHELHLAIRTKKQVLLRSYRSARGKTERDRLVEPIQISPNAQAVWAYEPRDQTSKLFKVDRIGEVKTLPASFQFEAHHQEVLFDFFGLPLRTPKQIKIKMGVLSASVLQEEYPASRSAIVEIEKDSYILDTEVDGYAAISRFVLGLMDDIQILGPEEWREHLSFIQSKSLL